MTTTPADSHSPVRKALVVGVVGLALVLLGGASGWALARAAAPDTTPAGSSPSAVPEQDFFFQVVGYQTANQGGQRLNMFFHYRYDAGIAVSAIPNYVDIRTDALDFMDAVDAAENPYWEVLAERLCTQLSGAYPVESISCQLQVYPDDRPGLPYEPGYHGTTYTIGDIEPLAIPGPTSSVEQCALGDVECASR